MSGHDGEFIRAAPSLAQLAVTAHEKAQQERAEYEQTLNRALGAKPGPKNVAEQQIDAATAETIGTLGVAVNSWSRGQLQTRQSGPFPCYFATIDSEKCLLVYLPMARWGLCALVHCGEQNRHGHQHLRRLFSLADLGEAIQWSPLDCLRELLLPEQDRKTTWINLT
jgi:hypothetical protein